MNRSMSRVVAVTTSIAALVLAGCSTNSHGSTTTTTTTTAPTTPSIAPFLALFPFATPQAVDTWRAQVPSPVAWQRSPTATALHFAGAMGLTSLTSVIKTTGTATDQHVTIGQVIPDTNGRLSTAATIHVVLWGSGPGAPYEVVGTDDTTLSLTTPRYGQRVGRTLAVGGRISGVDESIAISVRRDTQLVGNHCCVAAGGLNSEWTAPVTFTAPHGALVVIIATTGGHIAAVERFAVTGVWAN